MGHYPAPCPLSPERPLYPEFLGLTSSAHSGERRRLQGGPSAAFQHPKGFFKKDEERHFSRACSDKTRNNGFKLKERRFRPNIRKNFFFFFFFP